MIDINNYPKYRDVLIMLHDKNARIRMMKMSYKNALIKNTSVSDSLYFLPEKNKKQIIEYCFDDIMSFIFDSVKEFCNRNYFYQAKDKNEMVKIIIDSQNCLTVKEYINKFSLQPNLLDILKYPINYMIWWSKTPMSHIFEYIYLKSAIIIDDFITKL